jgi:medium-chain acyl-[acyl-carrier-protein] hydrolase
VKPLTSAPARIRLFCFPYAGGGASIFRSWQTEVGPSIRIHPVRLPGRETRIFDPPLRSVSGLVETIAAEIEPALQGPFAFFGYSFGALLAFETARLLRRRHGLLPERLMVAALKAPQIPLRRKPIHDLPDPEFASEIRKFCGTPEPVLQNAELMNLVLPAIKADFTAYETYRYADDLPLGCPITAMGGIGDPSVLSQELAAWSEHTSGAFVTRMFPGGHFFLNEVRSLLTWAIVQDVLPALRAASTHSPSLVNS